MSLTPPPLVFLSCNHPFLSIDRRVLSVILKVFFALFIFFFIIKCPYKCTLLSIVAPLFSFPSTPSSLIPTLREFEEEELPTLPLLPPISPLFHPFPTFSFLISCPGRCQVIDFPIDSSRFVAQPIPTSFLFHVPSTLTTTPAS